MNVVGPTNNAVDFRILGSLEAAREGRVLDVGPAKQQTLLGSLLLHGGEVLSTDRLIEELWGAAAPATAAKAVQSYVCQLRKVLGREVIVTRPSGYCVVIEADGLDALRFERLVARGEAQLPTSPEGAAHEFREALALWRGRPLQGLQFGVQTAARVRRLEEFWAATLERRIEADLARGGHRALIAELQALVAVHPYRETLRAQLMLALYRSGRQADALSVYRDARRQLADDLGLLPGPELARLEQQMLQHAPQLELPDPGPPGNPAPGPPPSDMLQGARRIAAVLAAQASSRDRKALGDVLDSCAALLEEAGWRVEHPLGGAVGLFGVSDPGKDARPRAARAVIKVRESGVATVRMEIERGEIYLRLRRRRADPTVPGDPQADAGTAA